MPDLSITVTPSGGDWFVFGSDIALTDGIGNQILLAIMGGNVESSTTGIPVPSGTKRDDYWGNSFLQGEPEAQFNSEYERVVSNSVLDTAGLQKIDDAVKTDLKYLEDLGVAVVESVVSTLAQVDQVRTDIVVQEPSNLQSQAFAIIWDATREELTFTAV